MTRVKICGLTRETDLDAAVAAGADAVGLIAGVTVDTPRDVTLETAATLAEEAPPMVTSVLVTMPETVDAARERIGQVRPDAIQLHGVDPDLVAALGDTAVDVIAAVDPTDPDIDAYAAAADALLVDSVDADGGGGTGETHDWDRTADIVDSLSVPVVLAGGLTPANVTEAVATVDPFAVDTASGVEESDGVKDHTAITEFVAGVKSARVAP